MEDIRKAKEDVYKEQKVFKQESSSILESMKDVASKVGMSKYAKVFEDKAFQYRISSWFWLLVSGFAVWKVLSILTEFVEAFTVMASKNSEANLQIFFSKMIILSFLTFVLYQVIRVFNANSHLYALNSHKANSLKVLKSFVESTSDPKIRDAVLIQATKSIFDSGSTGYINSKDSSAAHGFDLLNIVNQKDH